MADQEIDFSKLPTQDYSFDDIYMVVDHRLQIEFSEMGERCYAKLLGYLRGSSLIVKLPTTWENQIPIKEDEVVTVKGFSGCIAYSFDSRVLKIDLHPYSYCHLSFPSSVQGKQIRQSMRAKVNFPSRLINPKRTGDKPINAVITNINALGVQVESEDVLGMTGDEVHLAFRFWLKPNDYEINFNASGIIQNALLNADSTSWQCGISFQGLRTTETMLLQHLVYEHIIDKEYQNNRLTNAND